MRNTIIGNRTAMNATSTKYGYSPAGGVVKGVDGVYRSFAGAIVTDGITRDASVLVKEVAYLNTVRRGNIVLLDGAACRIISTETISVSSFAGSDSIRVEFENLQDATTSTATYPADKVISVIWDTLENPEKAVDGTTAPAKFDEFTPQQLHDLRNGKVTLDELRTPAAVEDLGTALQKVLSLAGIIPATPSVQ